MKKTRKTKPLFDDLQFKNTDFSQERKRTIAKIMIQSKVDKFEYVILNAQYSQDILSYFDSFKRNFRKHFKSL